MANYAVNGKALRSNVMATFDGSTCEFDYCDFGSGDYRQKEQYEVPISAIDLPILNANDQGCSYGDYTKSSITTKVQIWSLDEN